MSHVHSWRVRTHLAEVWLGCECGEKLDWQGAADRLNLFEANRESDLLAFERRRVDELEGRLREASGD